MGHRKKATEQIAPDAYARRVAAEAAIMKRAYCDMFRFWRACPVKRCRKTRTCVGDADICLKRGVKDVPRRLQFQARQQLIAATPASAGPPERAARECMPAAFFELDLRRAAAAQPEPK